MSTHPSALALERHTESGNRRTHRDLVLACLSPYVMLAMTAAEISLQTGLDPVDVRRRLNDLDRMGKAHHENRKRDCRVTGTKAFEWTLVDERDKE